MPRAIASVLAAALALPAQDPPPLLLHLTMVGPAAWRARLGPTNLGSLLASRPAEAIWRGYADGIDDALRQARGEDDAFGRERARLLDYGGEVHVVSWLEQREDALHLPRWSAALIAGADGHTDLAALADECRAWLGRAGDAAATPWRDLRLTPPRLEGGRLVAVLASPEDAEATLARAAAFVCEPLPHPAVLRLQLELQPWLGLLRDRASERDLVAAALGKATRHFRLEVGCVGPRLSIDLSVAFGAGDRGITRGLFPASPGVPDLAWLIPEGIAAHRVGRADFGALWDALLAVGAAGTDSDLPAFRAKVKRAYGCDVGEDVIAHLGDQTLLLWWHSDAAAADATLFGDACLVAPVRDEQGLIGSASAWLQRAGVLAMPDEDGVLWADLAEAPPCTVAIGFGVACVAFGPHGRQGIDAVLDRAANGPRRRQSPTPPPGAPPGWNGSGSIDVVNLLAGHLGGMLTLARSLAGSGLRLPRADEIGAEVERWRPLLRRHQLGEAMTLAGTTAAAWQFRFLW